MAQLVERFYGIEEVRSSNLLGSTKVFRVLSERARGTVVMRLIRIEEISGSIPLGSTNYFLVPR